MHVFYSRLGIDDLPDTLSVILTFFQLLVKKYTMERLAEIYRTFCLSQSGGSTKNDDFDWIPGKILRCFYDKDFRYTILVCCCRGLNFLL